MDLFDDDGMIDTPETDVDSPEVRDIEEKSDEAVLPSIVDGEKETDGGDKLISLFAKAILNSENNK